MFNRKLRSFILIAFITITTLIYVSPIAAQSADSLAPATPSSKVTVADQDKPEPKAANSKTESMAVSDLSTSATMKEDTLKASKLENATFTGADRQRNLNSAGIPQPASPKQTSSSSSGWQFAFAPYFYMTGLSGTVGARGRTSDIDLDFSDVLSHFKVGFMGAFEAKKGHFVLLNDLMWIKLTEERDTPGQAFSSAKLGVNEFAWDPEVGYRVYETDRGSFDILGGFRMMSVETNLNFNTGLLPGFDVSQRKTWATPVVGVHGVANITKKLFFSGKFDIGGGVGADFTDQLYLGGGYHIAKKIDLIGGWRYLKTDFDDNSGFLFDTTMNGMMIGAKFSF